MSTDEVFGSLGENGSFVETTPYAPNSPYSATKAASDHLVRAYHHTYQIPVTLSNCSNNYGPYQFPEKLVPLMILNMLEGKSLPVYGQGRNVRDWLYVEDHASAIWTIMTRAAAGETYTVGGETQLSNIDLVHRLCDVRGSGNGQSRPQNTPPSFGLSPTARDTIFATPSTVPRSSGSLAGPSVYELDEGLARTVRWYLSNGEWIRRVKSGEYRTWIDTNYTAMKRT